MRVVLEILSGTDTARRLVVDASTPRVIGRAPSADEPFPHDPWMDDQHAALWCSGDHLGVRDLGTRYGTFVNQHGVGEALLSHGDRLQIGGTLFEVRVERDEVVPEGVVALPDRPLRRVEQVLWGLHSTGGELYGVLDAARDDQVVPWLMESGLQYQSLYEGVRGQELALVAPYLVSFPKGTAELEKLLDESWGRSWGIFLATSLSFRDTRRHLRRFLKVELEDGGRVLFRFYDPRVLRAYLPTCNEEESATFFGGVGIFMAEGREGATLLKFRRGSGGVVCEETALALGVGASRGDEE